MSEQRQKFVQLALPMAFYTALENSTLEDMWLITWWTSDNIHYSPDATSTKRTVTVRKKRPMFVAPRFVCSMWLRITDNSLIFAQYETFLIIEALQFLWYLVNKQVYWSIDVFKFRLVDRPLTSLALITYFVYRYIFAIFRNFFAQNHSANHDELSKWVFAEALYIDNELTRSGN